MHFIQQVGLVSCKATIICHYAVALMGYLPDSGSGSAQTSSAGSASLLDSCRQIGNHMPLRQLFTNQSDITKKSSFFFIFRVGNV